MKNRVHSQPRKMDEHQKSVLTALLSTYVMSRAMKRLESGVNLEHRGEQNVTTA